MFEDEDPRRYVVVRNDEDQYSIWPEERALPQGWHLAGCSGDKATCLDHIRRTWTDMRPKSLQEMAGS